MVYGLAAALMLLLAGLGSTWLGRARLGLAPRIAAIGGAAVAGLGVIALAALTTSPDWLTFVTLRRFTLDANHAWVSLLVFVLSAGVALLPRPGTTWAARASRNLGYGIGAGLAVAALAGALMAARLSALPSLTRLSYTGLELGLAVALLGAALSLGVRLATSVGWSSASQA